MQILRILCFDLLPKIAYFFEMYKVPRSKNIDKLIFLDKKNGNGLYCMWKNIYFCKKLY